LTGPSWGRYFVGPIQFGVCFGVVVACTLLGGQCMKVIINSSSQLFIFRVKYVFVSQLLVKVGTFSKNWDF